MNSECLDVVNINIRLRRLMVKNTNTPQLIFARVMQLQIQIHCSYLTKVLSHSMTLIGPPECGQVIINQQVIH